MTNLEPFKLTATSIAKSVNSGVLDPGEIADFYLQRISKLNPILNTHLFWDESEARKSVDQQIRQLSSSLRQKKDLPLAGVPILVKDNIMVKGERVTCGSKLLENHRAAFDATVVTKLRQAGALIIGRANMDEFGMGSSNENSAFGPVRNPWNLSHVAGGSSGGGASAVAADLSPLSIGTDTGGSIRQPASFCGIWGLKPSYGAVSRFGMVAYASSLDQIGPLARDSADLALLFRSLTGADASDSTSSDYFSRNEFQEKISDLKGKKIAILPRYLAQGLDAEVGRLFTDALGIYKQLGAEIIEIDIPELEIAIPTYYILATAEASSNLARFDGVRYGVRPNQANSNLKDLYKITRTEGFGREVKLRIMLGTYVLSSGYYDAYYNGASRIRHTIREKLQAIFKQGISFIATPTVPTSAFAIGLKANDSLSMYLSDIYTVIANLAGVPALSHPVGFDKKGLPVGLQLLAPHFHEEILLRSAALYEQQANWTIRSTPIL